MPDIPTIEEAEPIDTIRIKRGPYVMRANLHESPDGSIVMGNTAFTQIRPALLSREFFFRKANPTGLSLNTDNQILAKLKFRLKV